MAEPSLSLQSLHEIEQAYRAAKIYVLCEIKGADSIVTDLGDRFGHACLRQFDDFDALVTEAMDFRPQAIVCDVDGISKRLLVNIRRLRNDGESAGIAIVCRTNTLTPHDMGQLLSAGASGVFLSDVPGAEFIGRLTQFMEGGDAQELPRSRMFDELWAAQIAQNRALMPSATQVERVCKLYGLDIDVVFEPYQDIGGDMWGLIPVDENRLAVFIADFCGHGWRVAPHAIRMNDFLHATDIDLADPARMLSWLNQRLKALLPRGQFAAMVYGVIDIRHDRFCYGCASWMPFAVQKDGQAGWTLHEGRGVPLGSFADITYEVETIDFGPGGGLVLYSDALVETTGGHGPTLTSEGVAKGLNRLDRQATPADITCDLVRRLGLDRARLADDLTLFALRRRVS